MESGVYEDELIKAMCEWMVRNETEERKEYEKSGRLIGKAPSSHWITGCPVTETYELYYFCAMSRSYFMKNGLPEHPRIGTDVLTWPQKRIIMDALSPLFAPRQLTEEEIKQLKLKGAQLIRNVDDTPRISPSELEHMKREGDWMRLDRMINPDKY
jgi:hypothetical protein